MDYYFECECGRRILVRATQVEAVLPCACGRTNQVPRLSKLSKVSQPTPVFAPAIDNPVAGPAQYLLILSVISIVLLLLALAFDIFLLVGLSSAKLPQNAGAIDKQTQVFVRMTWGGVQILVNVIIVFGAMAMRDRTNYGYAKTAAILALIPGLSLCCVLGIPFGLMALNALNRPGVKESFSS